MKAIVIVECIKVFGFHFELFAAIVAVLCIISYTLLYYSNMRRYLEERYGYIFSGFYSMAKWLI